MNPSIGGPAKGHLVRELDALGGQMGISADLACIQMRLLNTGKGYAVHALRGQEDKPFYHTLMKKIVEDQENLELKQLMIDKLLVENGAVVGVEAETGEIFEAKCVILATGTYLRGRIVYGQVNYECGPNGLRSAQKLSASLLENGVELMRFKTGRRRVLMLAVLITARWSRSTAMRRCATSLLSAISKHVSRFLAI